MKLVKDRVWYEIRDARPADALFTVRYAFKNSNITTKKAAVKRLKQILKENANTPRTYHVIRKVLTTEIVSVESLA